MLFCFWNVFNLHSYITLLTDIVMYLWFLYLSMTLFVKNMSNIFSRQEICFLDVSFLLFFFFKITHVFFDVIIMPLIIFIFIFLLSILLDKFGKKYCFCFIFKISRIISFPYIYIFTTAHYLFCCSHFCFVLICLSSSLTHDLFSFCVSF